MNQIDEEYLSFYDIFLDILNNKWKIIIFVAVSTLGVFIFQLTQPKPVFESTTELNSIYSDEIAKYNEFNSLSYLNISQSSLLNKYTEKLDNLSIYKKAIIKYDLLDVTKYEDEDKFNQAVSNLASSIKLIAFKKDDDRMPDNKLLIKFKYTDQNKWLQALLYVDDLVNLAIKKDLQYQFESILKEKQSAKNYALEDINKKIENAMADYDKEILKLKYYNKFELEDAQLQIDDVILNYDTVTNNRLAFLNEQAAIARQLDIANTSIEFQKYSVPDGIIASVSKTQPFYFYGYIAIEKEAELILARDDKKAFMLELVDLEKKKRALQDEKLFERAEVNKLFINSIEELEKAKRSIEQDLSLKRTKLIYNKTPIVSDDKFYAAIMSIEKTKFEYQNSLRIILFLTALISGFISTMYIIISSGLRRYKSQLLKN